MYSDGGLCAGDKRNAIKTSQRSNGELRATLWKGRIEVNLWDVVTAAFSCVLHMKVYVGSSICGGSDVQFRVSEACVGKTVPKAVEGFDILLVEPAVSDVDAFGKGGLAIDACGRTFGVGGIGGSVILQAARPRDWEPAGGIDLASEDVCCGPTAFIARPPHLENGLDFVQPGHRNRLARVEDDDGVGVEGGNLFNEFVLVSRQSEGGLAPCPCKHHRRLCGLRRFQCRAVIRGALFRCIPVEADLLRIV